MQHYHIMYITCCIGGKREPDAAYGHRLDIFRFERRTIEAIVSGRDHCKECCIRTRLYRLNGFDFDGSAVSKEYLDEIYTTTSQRGIQ